MNSGKIFAEPSFKVGWYPVKKTGSSHLNILYIQTKFVKERVKANKVFPIIQNLGHFMVNLGGGSVLAW